MSPGRRRPAADAGRALGGSFAFMRVAVPALGPVLARLLRVALRIRGAVRSSQRSRQRPRFREHWRDYLVIGIVNSALPFVLFCFAEQYVTRVRRRRSSTRRARFSAPSSPRCWFEESLTLRTARGHGPRARRRGAAVGWQPGALSGTRAGATLACLPRRSATASRACYAKRAWPRCRASPVALC